MKILKILLSLTLLSFVFSKIQNQFLSNLKNELQEVHWAVLVAGSNGFWNYRHQSDVFHAYYVLLKGGLKPENIIVLAYDDIANDPENPFKGKVFNKPDPKGPGVNVYEGINIDYKGSDVTPQNFLNIIQGQKDLLKGIGSGRCLESKEGDNVFIYFSDHGSTGFIAFPSEYLYADKLNKALVNMHNNKMYNKLVFYLEACESGSMFNNVLMNDINVYATTAANPSQSSWATYCGPDDVINGVNIGSCLGDEYSVNWIEDIESLINNKKDENLDAQFQLIKKKTTHSEVQQYGASNYLNETVHDFQGYVQKNHKDSWYRNIRKFIKNIICKVKSLIHKQCQSELRKIEKEKQNEEKKIYDEYLNIAKKSVVDSRKAKVEYLLHKAENANDDKYEIMLKEELEHIKMADTIFDEFNIKFNVSNGEIVEKIYNFDCLRISMNTYKVRCGAGEYDLIYGRNVAAACNKINQEEIISFFNNICAQK